MLTITPPATHSHAKHLHLYVLSHQKNPQTGLRLHFLLCTHTGRLSLGLSEQLEEAGGGGGTLMTLNATDTLSCARYYACQVIPESTIGLCNQVGCIWFICSIIRLKTQPMPWDSSHFR